MANPVNNFLGFHSPLFNQDIANGLTNTSNIANALYNSQVNAAPSAQQAWDLYNKGIGQSALMAQTPGTSYGMTSPQLQHMAGLLNTLNSHIEGVPHAVYNNPAMGELAGAQAQQDINTRSAQSLGQVADQGLNQLQYQHGLVNSPLALSAAAPYSLVAQTQSKLAGVNNMINTMDAISGNVDKLSQQNNLSPLQSALMKQQAVGNYIKSVGGDMTPFAHAYMESQFMNVNPEAQASINKDLSDQGYTPEPGYNVNKLYTDLNQAQSQFGQMAQQAPQLKAKVDTFTPAIEMANKMTPDDAAKQQVATGSIKQGLWALIPSITGQEISFKYSPGNATSQALVNAIKATNPDFNIQPGEVIDPKIIAKTLEANQTAANQQYVQARLLSNPRFFDQIKSNPIYNNKDFARGAAYTAPLNTVIQSNLGDYTSKIEKYAKEHNLSMTQATDIIVNNMNKKVQ